MKHDIQELKSRIDIADLIRNHGVELVPQGREFRALCPFHTEKTPSFSVMPEKQAFYCFGCGAGGDHLEFIQKYAGCDTATAIEKLADMVGGAAVTDAAPKRAPATAKPKPQAGPCPNPIEPAPTTLRCKIGDQWRALDVVAAWPYRDRAGVLHGYTCRVEPEPGKKDVIPVVWIDGQWKQGALPEPRLLYGTELLDAIGGTVLLVEGEKAADAARRLLPDMLVMTWPGGCKAVSKADWSLLAGRKVVGWPDCDSQADARTGMVLEHREQPGMAAMLKIAAILAGHGCTMRIVDVPAAGTLPNGWDLADAEAEGWTGERVLTELRARLRAPDEIRNAEPDVPEPPPEYDPMPDEPGEDDQPFRVLGWNRGEAYYLPFRSRQVHSLSAGGHVKLNLLALAPLSYWMQVYPSWKKSGDPVDWTMAADSLIKMAHQRGIFDDEMVRGRGAWWDDGRHAVHLGMQVVIGGRPYSLETVPSRYIYEAGRETRLALGDALGNADAYQFVKICEALRWERPIYGKLLAGWVFLAPICGALDWRPHIWITGESGTGKSTVLKHVIKRALHRNMIFFVGDTTEAGVRQVLGSDALPVVFDEFESERRKSAQRVEDVMSLITQASSETEGILAKGGAGGKATAYRIRSMFCFSSIAVAIKQAAARSRITVLSLRPAEPESETGIRQYNDLITMIQTTLTPTYIDQMQARAVELIGVIRKNSVTFAEAAATVLKTRRYGDQIGTLLAGAYALHSTAEITRDEARQWLEKQDWSEETSDQDSTDKQDCLSYITAHVLPVHGQRGDRLERTIGELVAISAGKATDSAIFAEEADDTLARSGIRVEGQYVVIASGHKYVERILKETQWEASYTRTLLRLAGAERQQTMNFKGARKRGVAIPLVHIL